MSIFLTDIDNVCLDWTTAFQEFVYKRHPNLKLAHDSWTFGLTYEDVDVFIKEFNDATVSDDFGNIPEYRDAVEYITKLHNLGFEFVGITTCLGTENTVRLRQENLERVFGKDIFKKVHCLPLHSSKLEVMKQYKPTYWIDDKVTHSADGLKAGHISFNMHTPYNANETREAGVIVVSSWREVFEYVVKNLAYTA